MSMAVAQSSTGATGEGLRSSCCPRIAVLLASGNPGAGGPLVDEVRSRLPEAEVECRFGSAPSGGDGERFPGTLRREFGWDAPPSFLLAPEITAELAPLLLEALERGVVVVAPETGATREWLGPGFVPAAGEGPGAYVGVVESLLRDPEQRQAARRRASLAIARLRRRLGLPAPETSVAMRRCRIRLGSNDPGSWRSVPGPERAAAGTGGSAPGNLPLPRAVSVVIPTRGGPRLEACVRALREAAGALELQLILVVTGGLRGGLPPCDAVAVAEEPFVWSRANNAGLSLARHPYVLFLNDDCFFLRPGDLDRLVTRLEQCGHLVALAPRGVGFPPHWEQSRAPRGVGVRPTRFALCGACFLVRREAFDVAGRFDPRFATYGCDEVDWFYRARVHGYAWAVDADVSVEHEGSASFGELRREAEFPQSRALFRELHGIEPEDGPGWEPPRVDLSWVISSRNGAGHLGRCLGSIAAHREQFPERMEVVLALDGSTDPSAEVARAVNASFPEPLPLRVVRFGEAAGSAARAKNRALRLARGEVHLPMDDDDATLPGRAALLQAWQGEDPPPDVAVGDFLVVNLEGRVDEVSPAPLGPGRLAAPGSQNWGLWATAVRREAWARYGMHREDLRSNEDLDLWLRWMRDGARFRYVPALTHLYLLRQGSEVFREFTLGDGEEIRRWYREGDGSPALGLAAASAGPVAGGGARE